MPQEEAEYVRCLANVLRYGAASVTTPRGFLLVSASLGFEGWEYLSQVPDGFGRPGTSRQRNTHSTESREVRYPWHPWHDRMVTTHRSFTRNGRALFCCSVEEILAGPCPSRPCATTIRPVSFDFSVALTAGSMPTTTRIKSSGARSTRQLSSLSQFHSAPGTSSSSSPSISCRHSRV